MLNFFNKQSNGEKGGKNMKQLNEDVYNGDVKKSIN